MGGIRDFAIGVGINLPGAAGGAFLTYGVAAVAEQNKRDWQKQRKIANQNLVFPRDLERFAISMCFEFFEYQRRSIFRQPYRQAKNVIRLPVSKGITDKFVSTWEESSDDPFVGAMMENLLSEADKGNAVLSAKNQNFDPALLFGQLANLSGAGLAGGALKLGEVGMEGLSNFLSINQAKILQPYGMAINPFLTVLFKQPEFKRHVFSWKLIPRNPEEARIINAIIQNFKYHMLPDIANNTAGTILNYPNMVQISFYGLDNYLYRFKPCVIENIQMNYAPSSTGVSFFKGSQNVPTEIDFQISLLEIEYWTKLDFDPYTDLLGGGAEVTTGGNIPNVYPTRR